MITRNTNDVHQMQMLVLGLNLMVMAPIMCIGHYNGPAARCGVIFFYSYHSTSHGCGGGNSSGSYPAISLYPGQNRPVNQIMREKLMG